MPRAREHSRELTKAFGPVRLFLIIIGQMPFEIKHKEDGTVSFRFNKKGAFTLIFALTFIVSTINYIMVCIGIFSFFIGQFEQTTNYEAIQRVGPRNISDPNAVSKQLNPWEQYFVQRELVTIAVVWSWMTIALVGSSYVLFHGKYYVHYFNYWNKVVQVMDMDVTHGIKDYLIFENISFSIVLLTLGTLFVLPGVQVIKDTTAVLANFYFRSFNVEIAINSNEENDEEILYWRLYKSFGFLIMIFAYAGSRANIIQFLFFVRCLTNASKIWNDRLKTILTRKKGDLTQEELTSRRLDHRLILKDHYVIVQLFKMTDNLFSRVLLTYYSLQIMTVVLELYQLATLKLAEEDILPYDPNFGQTIQGDTSTAAPPAAAAPGAGTHRPVPNYFASNLERDKEFEDWSRALQNAGVVMILLGQGIFFAILTTRSAAKAYEEAMDGFNILRRSNYLSCNSKTERNFVHSLVFSFARNNPLNVTAGGYFAVDKTLIPSLVGTVLNYVVAVYTLQPDRGNAWNREEEVEAPFDFGRTYKIPSTMTTSTTTTTTTPGPTNSSLNMTTTTIMPVG